MDTPVLYKIMTEHSDREITGGDSWIGTMPPELYLDLGTGPALVARAFSKFVKEICEAEAAKLMRSSRRSSPRTLTWSRSAASCTTSALTAAPT